MKRWLIQLLHFFAQALVVMLLNGVSTLEADSSAVVTPHVRPSEWATPVASSRIANFHQVTPDIYRSAQPDERGFRQLQKIGIRSVLNLRQFHNDREEAEHVNIALYQTAMNTFSFGEAEIKQALQVIAQADKPVLVHCWHGADRTGAVIAAYRMVCQNWTHQQALDELLNGGYNYHTVFGNIPKLINQLDISEIRQSLGESACPH